MTDQDLRDRIETMLTTAASFARADEPVEARARARDALAVMAKEEAKSPAARELLAPLRRRAERQLAEYEKSRTAWNAKVAARGAEWMAREIAALRAPTSKHR